MTAKAQRQHLARLHRRLEHLRQLWEESERLIAFDRPYRAVGPLLAGCDEVGRGPLAGPITAAAVILPPAVFLPGLRDSKRLTAAERRALATRITRVALAWSISFVPARAVDLLGIEEANRRALREAVENLPLTPDAVLVDGPRSPVAAPHWYAVVDGDRLSQVTAAASVLAKSVRDAFMARLGEDVFPGYGFERHMGYGTAEHRQAIADLGPTALHRRTFLRRLEG